MTQIQSKFVTGQKTIVTPDQAGDVAAQVFYIDLAAALALNDIVELGVLPAYSRIVDATLDCDKLDTGGAPTLSLDVGIMSGVVGVLDGARTCGNELFAADTSARAGGTVSRLTKNAALRLADTDKDRSIGVKVVAAPQVGAVTGRIALIVYYIQ
ncbi:hypothetical protein [Paraburkholderia terrae]|uniref:hypothetical protein n=1 Tax=Paraburkholderia terrae TaxID=311230 RepID=UPI001EE37891|nr:hypothetical protein [Paraburkholderia terrae]GJH00219.1 hypothetical protein CBA19C8_06700 [Paraburkholderia terrae]